MEFITDRTQDHVDRLKTLRSIGWKNMSDSQKTEYNEYASKGAYNYIDLNRVETAVAEISNVLGLSLTTKTDWTLWDIPTVAEMSRYLSNVVSIRNAYTGNAELPALPGSMNYLTYSGANNIEKVLKIVYDDVVVKHIRAIEDYPEITG